MLNSRADTREYSICISCKNLFDFPFFTAVWSAKPHLNHKVLCKDPWLTNRRTNTRHDRSLFVMSGLFIIVLYYRHCIQYLASSALLLCNTIEYIQMNTWHTWRAAWCLQRGLRTGSSLWQYGTLVQIVVFIYESLCWQKYNVCTVWSGGICQLF